MTTVATLIPSPTGNQFNDLRALRKQPYVPRHCLPEVRREIRHYQRFKVLITEWVTLSMTWCPYI
jgi:hypothetical protein